MTAIASPTGTGARGSAYAGSPTLSPANPSALGKDEFLKLLVAQLRNQDPTNPLQPHEFAAQLAQFTSVEQLTQLNDALATQLAAMGANTLAIETTLGAALIGRPVLVESTLVAAPADGPALVTEVGASGGTGTLTLTDATGRVVAEVDLGYLGAGRHAIELPDTVPPGVYGYTLTVTNAAGDAVPARTFVTGVVDGLHFADGAPVLRLGDLTVPLDRLAEVLSAPPSLDA